ncbi:hypothetical protein NP233_g2614 [Leucocoprinus birnbaumii]|uniref:F-box domain-containing protein n=1 Tax=Leucocoprinus birnbaumii TaxID=56174 RepID=A0AAD5YUQ0_9AGAR|nr:hypothetical protein NP233_g2614 [Leucocoprinus birnbaumii]
MPTTPRPSSFRLSAMAQAPPHLPQELVDSIIAYVDDDRATLVSCAQVSRFWLHSSRQLLFANISLSPHSSGKSLPQQLCQRLYRVLQDSPGIIQYIRHLQIVDGGSSPNVPTRQWIASERTLAPLLKLLTHVRQLELGASSSSSPLQWKSLPFALQNAICTVLKLSTLSFVRIHTSTFPNLVSLAAVMSSCQNLKGLSLSSVTVDEELEHHHHHHPHHHSDTSGQTISITLPPPPTQLSPLLVSSASLHARRSLDTEGELGIHTELELDDQDGAVESGSDNDDNTVNTRVRHGHPHLEALSLEYVNFGYLGYWLFAPSQSSSPINFAHLRELKISRSADPLVVEQILISIGPSLEYLHLKPGTWDVFRFDLRRNPNLNTLRLTLEKSETALGWCTTLLSSLTPSGFLSSSSPSSGYPGYNDPDELQLSHISFEFWTNLEKLSASASTSASSTASSSLSNSPNRSSPSLLPSSSPPLSSSPLSSFTLPFASSASSASTPASASTDERSQSPEHQQPHTPQRQKRSFTLSSKLEPTWACLDSILSFLPTPLTQVDVGLFAQSTSPEFRRVREALRGVCARLSEGEDVASVGEDSTGESDCDEGSRSRGTVRLYQLGLKSQRSIGRICGPRLRSFESDK